MTWMHPPYHHTHIPFPPLPTTCDRFNDLGAIYPPPLPSPRTENRQVYPALMEAAMAEPLNATDVAPSIGSIRELVGVRPNPRL